MATSTLERNISFAKMQFSAALENSSVVVKFVCIAVFLCYFISFSENAMMYLTVVPGYAMPPNFWFWTYLTHSFIEVHIWCVLVDIGIVILYGKLLEPLWGALEILIFYAVVNLGVAVMTTLVYMFLYLISKNEEYLFEVHIHGLAGYVAGFSVAVKQVMPDHVLVNSPFGKMRNKHVPMWLLYFAILLRVIGGLDGPYPIMFGLGLLISWIYLRFYQKHSNGNRGDLADSFNFASFFPETIQPFINIISNTVFSALVKIKICKKPQRRYDVSAPTTITVSLPGTDPQDAERRRQVALKALNDRLNKSDQTANWPSLDEAEEGGSTETPPATPTSSTPSTTTPSAETRPLLSPAASSHTPKLPVPDFKENAKSLAKGGSL